eukprot:11030310-Alexandrium_andersonii.AAC.1
MGTLAAGRRVMPRGLRPLLPPPEGTSTTSSSPSTMLRAGSVSIRCAEGGPRRPAARVRLVDLTQYSADARG